MIDIETVEAWLVVLLAVIGAAAQLAALWKKPKAESFFGKLAASLHVVTNALAGNYGHAANRDGPTARVKSIPDPQSTKTASRSMDGNG